MEPIHIFLIIWLLLPILLLALWLKARRRLKNVSHKIEHLEERFEPIISIEQEAEELRVEIKEIIEKIKIVRASYSEKRLLLEKIERQVAVYDERISFAELGVYEPHFDFGDAEIYKDNIKAIRSSQKDMVSAKTATLCPTNWTVDGSRSKGQTMINRQTRLTMRAFNNECEAAIANTRWNNVLAMEKRILNAAKQINSANASMSLEINDEYVALKLNELHLTHEYREQLKIERDKRTERARAEREEKRLVADTKAAEQEEYKYQKLLDRARKEAGTDLQRIEELEAALAEAHENTERARAMAEMTKSGYVYIISNIGSFGEDVVKIGMTRRLDPDDRVRELGDASVPFSFDTHAMIYSPEAPALEAALHKEFTDVRVNTANMRKEFFRVGLEQVEEAVTRLAPDADFFKDREAQDWHETLARRKQALVDMQTATDAFPAEI